MAQQTSSLWKALLRDRNTEKEYAFNINGVWYGPEAEASHSVDAKLFEAFGIGNAMSASLSLSLYAEEIPRGAVIKRYVRLVNGSRSSEWLPKGEFFVNRRVSEDGFWTVEAYDAMLKADIAWTPRPGFTFPCTMEAAARDIALSMGVELDERNVYLPYTMDAYPEGEYMRRDALRDIAAAHGGNWFISDQGKLRLIPLISFPAETGYLVTEHGDSILFGGTRILLSSQGAAPSDERGGDSFYVGLDLTGCEDNGKRPPITSVTLQVDGENTVTAGTYTGLDLYALCPYATYEMATAILVQVQGYQYQAFSAESANIDPAMELGDGVTAGGLYAAICAIGDSGDGYPSLSAPGEEELEDEYPYHSPTQRELSGNVDTLRAYIQKAIGEQQIELNSMKAMLQEISQTLQQISNKVTELDSRVTALGG